MKKINELIKRIESVGLTVIFDDSDKINPHIEIYRKPKSKKSMFELIFDKKGNIINIVCGELTKACWIDLPKNKKK